MQDACCTKSIDSRLYLNKTVSVAQSDVRASSVLKGTIETDNKMRQGVLRKNSTRFEEPSPPPPDPNSEAKSETIRRMQRNLEEWNEELKAIHEKKMKNGAWFDFWDVQRVVAGCTCLEAAMVMSVILSTQKRSRRASWPNGTNASAR